MGATGGPDSELWLLSRKKRMETFAEIGAQTLGAFGVPPDDFPTWAELLWDQHAAQIHELCVTQGLPFSYDLVREELHQLYSLARWASFGFNIFRVSEDLATGLLMTDPPNADEPLHLPFPNFCIHLPPGVIPIYGETRYWAESIWVETFTSRRRSRADNERQKWLRWSACYKTLRVWKDRHPNHLDDVEDENFYNLENDPPPVEEDALTTSLSLRFVRNLCAWLSATGGLKDSMRKRSFSTKRKKRKKNKPAGTPKFWLLGQDVKLPRELRERREDFALGRSRKPPKGWEQRVRCITRGHFQHYWVGSEGSRRRILRWKEPYWRNLDSDVAVGHSYSDEERS
jgi:hypothetical protein